MNSEYNIRLFEIQADICKTLSQPKRLMLVHELRTGEKKVEQISKTGAKIVVSPCENCRLQLDTLNEKYNIGIKITSMMDLVADNMQISSLDL